MKAPGLKYGAARSDGSRPIYWVPKRANKKAPAGLLNVKLPDDASDEFIQAECQRLTAELENKIAMPETRLPSRDRFDGTIASLIRCYCTFESSPYRQLKFSTQESYRNTFKVIERTVGKRKIDALTGEDFMQWYNRWSSNGRIRRGGDCIKKLRLLLSFGKVQRFDECMMAREILREMRFPQPAKRKVTMSYDMAKAVIDQALLEGRPSMALTQAIQYETALRRIDVIGEWAPLDDGEHGGIVQPGRRWTGPSRADVGEDLVLRLEKTAKGGHTMWHDLKECELVMYVLDQSSLPAAGPLIVNEDTGLPYTKAQYAGTWRKLADRAGLPRAVKSMDSRSGAITETAKVASLEDARQTAGHSSVQMTQNYYRDTNLDHNRDMARLRRANRNKTSSDMGR